MRLKIAEDLNDTPVSSVDLFNDGVRVCVTTQNCILEEIDEGCYENPDDCPSEGIRVAEDGVIDVVVTEKTLNRERIAAALRQVNAKMSTNFELE